MNITFNSIYFLWFLLLLATEIAIALFLKTGFIRHTFGDFLVVILIYCFIKSFWNTKPLTAGIFVLLTAYAIEFLQLSNFLEHLNLSNSTAATLIFGNTFQFGDLLAYTLGISTILFIEHKFNSHETYKSSTQ